MKAGTHRVISLWWCAEVVRVATPAPALVNTRGARAQQNTHKQEPGATVLVAGATGGVGQLVTAKLLGVRCVVLLMCVAVPARPPLAAPHL